MDGEFLQGYTIDASSSIGEVEAGDDYDGRLFHQDGTKGSLSVTTNVGDIDIEIE